MTKPPLTTPSSTPTLELRHLHRFFGRLHAVNDVSFQAHAGQVMGFIGPNGAGKTTSMRILATLDTPTSGDAFVCGYSVVDDPDTVRRLLGFMPDDFGRSANMNVVEYLDFFARAYGYRGDRRRDAVERVLVFTELRRLADKPIDTLSRGMSQRLGLGRTLIHDPQVLILDEPAAGLDPRARVELRELIQLLAVELDKTILISSHILTELGEICGSAAIIEAGRILASGTIDELQRIQRSQQEQDQGGVLVIRLIREESDRPASANGSADQLEAWLAEQPFVGAIKRHAASVTIAFRGDEAARFALLKKLVEDGFPVVQFEQKAESLEDAFMTITRGITQ